MDMINFFANEYNEANWKKFSNCFKEYTDLDDCFEVIPKDIVNVLIGLLGVEESKEWIKKNLKQLDFMTVVELSKTEKGLNALKAFIMRMPN